uniref:Uncharacterized protein n=1 Tax=Zosterops lateralis melanops TaxID=1220523 RepID=A0A8D2Q0R1_ZOSLA
MQGRITAQAFSFDQQFKPYQKDEFLMMCMCITYLEIKFLKFIGYLYLKFIPYFEIYWIALY